MFIKASVLACVLVTASVGCRKDRHGREANYGIPIKPQATPTETWVQGVDVPQSRPARTEESPPASAQGRTAGVRKPMRATRTSRPPHEDVDEDADTSSIPTTGGTNGTVSHPPTDDDPER